MQELLRSIAYRGIQLYVLPVSFKLLHSHICNYVVVKQHAGNCQTAMWFSSWLIHLCVRLSWSPCMYAAVVAHPATQSLCLTHANNIMTLIGEWALPVRLNEAHAHTNPIKLEASVHWGAQSKNLKASTRASSAHQVNKYLILRQPCVSSCSECWES